MVLTKTIAVATRMGSRAGQHFRETGMPTPNPFPAKQHADLATAWRTAYFASQSSHTTH